MTGNTFGKMFRVTTCGESYSGCFRKSPDIPKELYGGLLTIVDGVPAGIRITAEDIQAELDKRKPGQSPLDSPRKERDRVYIFSGVMEDQRSTGAPVGIVVPNNDIEDIHVGQYHDYKDMARPGHAEYTFMKKYGQYNDWVGAGRASGRETVSRVAGGAVAKLILDKYGIDVIGYVTESHGIKASGTITYEQAKANYRKNDINCPDLEAATRMEEDIMAVRKTGETCGGVIELLIHGLPAGLGEPVFDKLEATLAHALMSIGAIKGIEFGAGFRVADMLGSECNDEMYWDKETGRVKFYTNNAGGFLGGISNGDEVRIRLAVKPTPTVDVVQRTVDTETGADVELSPITRRDASLLPRIYPVCEAMARIAIVDALMQFKGYRAMEDIDEKYDNM